MSDHARVLFFANMREKTGVREATIEFEPGTSVSDLKKLLVEKYPGLKQYMDTVIVAMNHEFAFDENIVGEGAEIALFPPVSGGSEKPVDLPTMVELVEDEIDINNILKQIITDTTGAACIFSGIVRGVTKRGSPHLTEKLEYEAYQVMAVAKMQQICEEIRSQWQEVVGLALVQRTGILSTGEISVIIACSAPHRDCGIFEAARYGIDRLKEIVPIWKKEMSREGEIWVEGDYFPQRGE